MKMKKYIKSIILTTISIGFLSSCQSELDNFNVSPNSPTITTPSLLLASIEVSTFSNHTSGLNRNANIFSQHLAGTDIGQLGPVAKYIVTEENVNNEWNTIYNTTLMSGYVLNKRFATSHPYYNGIAQVLTAVNLAYVTDMFGDVPFDEAFKAEEGIKSPKYNTQKEIYERLQTTLDKAIANLNKPEASNATLPSADDFIFNGDPEKWIKTAYVLKARFALRLTQVDPNAAQKALDYINASGISSNNDDMNTFFTGKANELNQWNAYNVTRVNYLKMGKTFVDYLTVSNDPRKTFLVAKDKSGNYSGNAPEDQTSVNTSYIGSAVASADSNVGIVTYSEAKFIEAEAKFRLNDLTGAKSAFKIAVQSSILKITKTPAQATFVDNVTAIVSLENIIQQKYNALFLTMEPYNDYRRTGFPVLVPNQNATVKAIPLRLPTPSDERNYNKNATVVSNVTTNVWWDKN
ncbi:SusD/RagB family nutrient-binding outer membrane lipoprotein [Flavobacterium sp. ZT3R18]|nr:SusD/RagB family nutrient-binding outer membrane lipoprotein [Flavobacterium sp. ZT3R18]